jgi:hypothetical protein
MNIKQYLIIGVTLKESISVFDYMCWLLRDKIARASKVGRWIEIDDYILKFTCDELYWRHDRFGTRAEVINALYVERLLDTYKTLARI